MKQGIVTVTIIALSTILTFSARAQDAPAIAETTTAAPESTPAVAVGSTTIQPAAAEPVLTEKAEQTVRIGFVDMAKIAGDSVPGKAAQNMVQAKTKMYRSQITAKEKQLEKQKKTIEAQIAALSPQQREAKAKEFQKKLDEYRKLVTKAEKEVQTLQEKLLSDLYKSIEKASGDYGKAQGLIAVVMKKDLLFAGEKTEVKDITEDIIKLLDK